MGIAAIKQAVSKFFDIKKDVRIVMLGLDGAGKTTILYKLKLDEPIVTIPTIGFNVETVTHKNLSFTIWDIGGQDKIRKLWNYYFQGTLALIYVVDSNDLDRIEEAADELWRILNDDEMNGKPVLVFANKQDLLNSLPVKDLIERLRLITCKSRPWMVQSACARNGDGIYEGMEWLAKECSKLEKTFK
jgi:small GTP-binding protein